MFITDLSRAYSRIEVPGKELIYAPIDGWQEPPEKRVQDRSVSQLGIVVDITEVKARFAARNVTEFPHNWTLVVVEVKVKPHQMAGKIALDQPG